MAPISNHLALALLLLAAVGVATGAEQEAKEEAEVPRVAIIGGGMAGTTTAFFLTELFQGKVRIDVYEPNEVGGRVATVTVAGREYESGASIIHPRNRYMRRFVEELGLRDRADDPGRRLVIYDGSDIIFRDSDWSAVSLARLVWRYGYDVVRLRSLVRDFLAEFDALYDLQAHGYAFTTAPALLAAAHPSLSNLTRYTARTAMTDAGLSRRYVEEVVKAAIKVAYGQDTMINALAGYVAAAGVEPGLWSVHGGNKLIPQRLLEETEAILVKRKVTKVALIEDGDWRSVFRVESIDPSVDTPDSPETTEHPARAAEYDQVVVAIPLVAGISRVAFEGFPRPIAAAAAGAPYHRTVVTFVQGRLDRAAALGCDAGAPCDDVEQVLTAPPGELFFNSIGRLAPVDHDPSATPAPPVYKIFSRAPLSDDELARLFPEHGETRVVDWAAAYPHYAPPDPPHSLAPHKNVFDASGIEGAASAMEMAAVGARNAALLAYHAWRRDVGWVNARFHRPHRPRGEL